MCAFSWSLDKIGLCIKQEPGTKGFRKEPGMKGSASGLRSAQVEDLDDGIECSSDGKDIEEVEEAGDVVRSGVLMRVWESWDTLFCTSGK
jgi:hypothetical protein